MTPLDDSIIPDNYLQIEIYNYTQLFLLRNIYSVLTLVISIASNWGVEIRLPDIFNLVNFAEYSSHFNDPDTFMAKLYSPIKIILADDHDVLRDGFHALLKKQNDIEIIGEAKNGQQLVDLTRRLQPDVIITDFMMPVKTGMDAIREITKEFPAIGIIAFSMYNEEELILDMLKAGAIGYILKSSGREEVVAAIKAVHKGQPYYCKETDGILKTLLTEAKQIKPKLSEKEITIIQLICRELSSPEIAKEMGLSRRTVEGYWEQIMEKIGAKNTAGIVMFAVRNKLFEFRK